MTTDALDVRAKRIYDPLDGSDGYRIMIDHVRLRGVSRRAGGHGAGGKSAKRLPAHSLVGRETRRV